jgi:hypothetical protein
MTTRWIALFALGLTLPACWGGTSSMTMGPRARLIETPPRARRPTAWEMRAIEAAPLPGRPFAETPITPFAERITDFALAAAYGAPLPSSPVATRHPLDGHPVIEWSERIATRPERLEAIAVAVELEVILKRGEPDDAAPSERWGSVHATLVVTRNGLRVVSLRPGAVSSDPRGAALPQGLEGFETALRTLLGDLRSGDVLHYELDDRDRRLLANEAVWAQLHEDGPPLARAHQVGAILETLPHAPIAYVLDDVGVLARDDDGHLYGLSLELDPAGGTFALATTPLVSVRRLWPQ